MKGLYYPDCDLWQARKGSNPSWGWQSLLTGRDIIAPQLRWVVGNGKRISIREDKWLKNGPLGGSTTRNEPCKVAELIEKETAQWDENLLRTMFDEQLVTEIKSIPIGLPTTEDKLVWTGNKSGKYTVRSGYHSYRSTNTNKQTSTPSTSYQQKPELWKLIWKSVITPKIKFFLWNACQNALPTMENLFKRKIVPAPTCLICKIEPETVEHTLFLCPWTSLIWNVHSQHLPNLRRSCGGFGRTEITSYFGKLP